MNSNVKEEAQRLIELLPENSTWDDLMHRIYVRQAIERGVEDSRSGRTSVVGETGEEYGLPK